MPLVVKPREKKRMVRRTRQGRPHTFPHELVRDVKWSLYQALMSRQRSELGSRFPSESRRAIVRESLLCP